MSNFFRRRFGKIKRSAKAEAAKAEAVVQDGVPSKSPNVERTTGATTQSENEHGMFVLVDQPRDEPRTIDIVALHGLNGHYYNTWSSRSSGSDLTHNWLEQDLPVEIPNARVMSYGYDSAIFSKSVAGIGTFADQLLEELMSVRLSATERERPLLFICHSLGGIVFKKALIRARERDRYEETLKKVRGVAFFGTPHRGSSIADWTTMLVRILAAASLGMTTNYTLLDNLQTQSEVLFDISKAFVDRGKGLSITSFFETQKLPHTNFRVVDESSAVLLVPNETAIPLSADHRSMCRFSDSPEDKRRIKPVLRNLREVVDDFLSTDATFTTKLSEEEQRNCLRQLYPGNYESFKNFNVERAPGTCEWFLKHPQYRNWREDQASTLLWVSADAGCGKSTLAKFLVDHLRTTKSPEGLPVSVCHFFFKEGITEQESTTLAVRAVLHQIFGRDPALMRHIFPDYEAKGVTMMSELNTLALALVKIIRDPEAPSFILVFDGLDECPENDLKNLLQTVNILYPPDHKSSRPNQFLKVLMWSRPENLIKNALKRQPMTIRLKGEDEIESIGKDVSLVIRHCINELGEDGIPNVLLDDFSENLEAGADNTFLWVTLMIQILKDHNRSCGGTSRNEIKQLLKNRDIFSIYKHLLRKISNQGDTRRMLQIILAGERALTVDEMSIALASAPLHQTLKDISFDIKYPYEDYVKSLGGHFIRIIRSEIYLVHQTAREFLLGFQQSSGIREKTSLHALGWQHSITMKDAHRALLIACVSYLVCGERSRWDEFLSLTERTFARRVPPSAEVRSQLGHLLQAVNIFGTRKVGPNSFDHCVSIHPFLWYASTYWTLHFELSELEPSSALFIQVMEFCQIVPDGLGYPVWTQARSDFVYFRGECWDRGQKLSHFAKRARIFLGLRMGDVTTRFLELMAGENLEDGDSLLHLAAALGTVQAVKWLLEHGADVNALDSQLQTVLHLALENVSVRDMVTLLIESGADINARGRDGQTALHCAARFHSAAITKMLIEKGADTAATDAAGATPLWYETEADRREMVELLLTHAPDVTPRERNKKIVHVVTESGSPAMIARMLEQTPDINVVDDAGYTPARYIRRRPTMDFKALRRLTEDNDW